MEIRKIEDGVPPRTCDEDDCRNKAVAEVEIGGALEQDLCLEHLLRLGRELNSMNIVLTRPQRQKPSETK